MTIVMETTAADLTEATIVAGSLLMPRTASVLALEECVKNGHTRYRPQEKGSSPSAYELCNVAIGMLSYLPHKVTNAAAETLAGPKYIPSAGALNMGAFILDLLYYYSQTTAWEATQSTTTVIDNQFKTGITLSSLTSPTSVTRRKRLGFCETAIRAPAMKPSTTMVIDRLNNAERKFSVSDHLHVAQGDVDDGIVYESWVQALIASSTVVLEERSQTVPVFYVDHENEQLFWKRPNLPECARGSMCAARDFVNSQGALNICLYPDEQMLYQAGKLDTSDMRRCCLHCIRLGYAAYDLTMQVCLENNRRPAGSGSRPPFRNLVDMKGGYKKGAIGVHSSTSNMKDAVDMVGAHNPLEARYCAYRQQWYVDQSSIIYNEHSPEENHFLFKTAAVCTK